MLDDEVIYYRIAIRLKKKKKKQFKFQLFISMYPPSNKNLNQNKYGCCKIDIFKNVKMQFSVAIIFVLY